MLLSLAVVVAAVKVVMCVHTQTRRKINCEVNFVPTEEESCTKDVRKQTSRVVQL